MLRNINIKQTIVSAILTVAVGYSANAAAFLYHSSAAECELYEASHGFTIGSKFVSTVAPGAGTVSLSCPVVESDTFLKASARRVFVDGKVGIQSGSFIKAKACSNSFNGDAVHCGPENTAFEGVNGFGFVELLDSDISPAWGDTISSLDYPYLDVSLSGVGTYVTGYEIDDS